MSSFSIYWPNWLCDRIVNAGLAGTPMHICFFGDNVPGFRDLSLGRDDELIAITVREGRLLLIARMRIASRVDAASWLAECPADALYVLDDRSEIALIGVEGTPIRFDRPLSPELARRWRKNAVAYDVNTRDTITDPLAFNGVQLINRALRAALSLELRENIHEKPSDLEELAARAIQQRDEASVLVYADALLQAGDPRGEVIILEHQLEARPDREAMEAIEARLIELNALDRSALFGKPGGFPFRGAWGTRAHLRATMGRLTHLTPISPAVPAHEATFALFERLGYRPWLKRFDFHALGSIHGHRDALAALRERISAVLAGYDHVSSNVWTCDEVESTVAMDVLHALIAECEDGAVPGLSAPLGLRLSFRFRLRDPATGHPLPFQAGLHYPSIDILESMLELDLKNSAAFLDLVVPFETITEEFRTILKIVENTLGRAPREDAIKILPEKS